MTAFGEHMGGTVADHPVATQSPEHLATVTAAFRRCIATGNTSARITLWQQAANTLVITTVPGDAPHASADNLGPDLALIDRLALRWGHRGNHHRRTLWALISH